MGTLSLKRCIILYIRQTVVFIILYAFIVMNIHDRNVNITTVFISKHELFQQFFISTHLNVHSVIANFINLSLKGYIICRLSRCNLSRAFITEMTLTINILSLAKSKEKKQPIFQHSVLNWTALGTNKICFINDFFHLFPPLWLFRFDTWHCRPSFIVRLCNVFLARNLRQTFVTVVW